MERLPIGHGDLRLGSFASPCGVEAEDAGGEDAELKEDHGCSGGDDHRPGGAHHLALRVVTLHKHPEVLLTPWVSEAVNLRARVHNDLLGELAVPRDNLLAKVLVENKPACVGFRHFCCGGCCCCGGGLSPSPTKGLEAFSTLDRVALLHAELDVHLEPHNARVAELESLEASLEVPLVGKQLETGEDDRVGGATAGVKQLDLVLVVPTDRLEVPGKDAKDGLLVHLDPEEQLLSKACARDVLAGGGGDPAFKK